MTAGESNNSVYKPYRISLLEHKFTLPKCDTIGTRFIGPEVCARGKQALWVTSRTPVVQCVLYSVIC